MDPASLFKKDSRNKAKTPKVEKTKISVIDNLPYLPVIYGLKKNVLKHTFSILTTNPNQASNKLKEGEVELALVPSSDYGQKKETWRIIPNISVSSKGVSKDRLLFFRKGLKDIKSIAVDVNASSSFLLLKILMKEKFYMNPDYHKMKPDLDGMLSKTDAAFITGDKAFEYFRANRNYLDLGEEWYDLTGLPFVYSFWAGREFTVRKEEINILKKAYQLGIRNLEKISKVYAETNPESWSFYHDYLTKNRIYNFSDQERDGLMEFYNYAFFYGYIKYIPDLFYYEL
jgi:chorismate dehydratase